MFTKNFYKVIAHRIFNVSKQFQIDYYNGNTMSWTANEFTSLYDLMKTWTTSYNGKGFQLGYGETPATIDDYELDNLYLEQKNVAYSVGYKDDSTEDNFSMTVTYTFTNNGTEAFTISEYGIMYSGCLLYREVFTEPLVLQVGEVGQIKIKIEYPLPTE